MKKRIFVLIMASIALSQAFSYEICDRNDVPGFDRQLMTSYSSTLDTTGTVLAAGLLLAPTLLVLVPTIKKEYDWTNGGIKAAAWMSFMYAESILTTYATKELLKHCITKNRPYMYFAGAPENEIASGEFQDSFPSGHTSLAFCAASFLSVSYCKLFPQSRWKPLVIAASFGTAAGIGATRIAAGCHFTSDVLMGAAIGTICGGLFPLLQLNDKNVRFAFTGNGMSVSMKL